MKEPSLGDFASEHDGQMIKTFVKGIKIFPYSTGVLGNLNLMVTSVNTRARNMRKKGVPLKHFPKKARVSTVKDEAYWAAIAAEARAALPEGDEEE